MRSQVRRHVLIGLAGFALCVASDPAGAKVLTTQLTPVVTLGYTPGDQDERGLWQACGQLEEQIATSNLRIKDPQINDYLLGVMQRLLRDQAQSMRVYVMRNPDFNASMTPNGMMIVNTGFLARVRNEAQLSAVLGHEVGHYVRRHSLQGWRSRRTKSAVMAFVAAGSNVASGYSAANGYSGTSWYDIANTINQGLMLSIFSYSRDLESEADAYGIKLLTEAGYVPNAASEVWAQLIEERKASAAVRKKKYRDNSRSSLSTHPPSVDRMTDLAHTGEMLRQKAGPDARFDERRAEFLTAMAPYRAMLLDEQIKLNDPGASLYLVNSLAKDGWDSMLRFYEGEAYRLRDEVRDADRAAHAYKEAVQYPDASPEALRAYGYSQLKNGSREEGRSALRRYLEMRPDASDAEIVRFTLE